MYFDACLNELEKTALFERLVRLGATPIPGTPKLLMKSRSPQELKTLQHSVESGWNKRVTDPIMGVLEKGIKRLPEGKVQSAARWHAKGIAQDPIGAVLTEPIPVPGASLAYRGLKRGLEHAIDRVAPLPK
jgi:hypothetical protein